MNKPTVVPLQQPKRMNDFQRAVEELVDSDDFGRLTIAETISALQIVILNLWQRLRED